MYSLMQIIYVMISFYMWVLIGAALLSWLRVFNVVNSRNEVVVKIGDALSRLTEPALRPIRKFVPTLGGMDMSFLALFFLLMFLRFLIQNNFPMAL
jgi:YggT family protein